MDRLTRERTQSIARIGGLAFVVVWLFSDRLQTTIPFWLPFVVLVAAELELVVRGLRERRRGAVPPPSARRLPGADDADLGWVESVDDDGEPILVAAPPRPRRGSPWPLLLTLVAALGLFAYAYQVDSDSGWPSLTASEQASGERRFTAEAATIAGRAVTVRCDNGYTYTGPGSDAAGVAFIPRALAFLDPAVCHTLYRVAFEDRIDPRDDAAFAITVLAHEATHLRGVRNEAETECYALQEGVGLGERLGLTPATARALMRAQRDRDLSDSSIARLDYRLPAACRNGGALDLRPDDSTFP